MASQGVADPPCFSDRVHPAVKPNVAKVWLNTTPIVRGVSEAFRVVKLRGRLHAHCNLKASRTNPARNNQTPKSTAVAMPRGTMSGWFHGWRRMPSRMVERSYSQSKFPYDSILLNLVFSWRGAQPFVHWQPTLVKSQNPIR